MNVVQFPENNLQDVPANLRRLADDIEAGRYGDIATSYTILPQTGDYPLVFGFGNVDGPNDPMIQFQLALYWFCRNMTGRLG